MGKPFVGGVPWTLGFWQPHPNKTLGFNPWRSFLSARSI